MKVAALLFLISGAVPVWADLPEIKAEPSADKRATKALDYAGKSLSSVREHLSGSSIDELKKGLTEFQDAMDLTMESLGATGKNPAKNPNQFKKVELRLREYMRKLKTLEHDLGFEERALVRPVIEHVEKIQDELVQGIMRKK